MKDKKKSPYLKPLAFAISFFVLGIFVTKIYNFEGVVEFIGDLSDCFLIPGVLLSGAAGISWAGTFGTFDMISFGTRSFFGIFIRPLAADLPRSFYDYRVQKDEKGRRWSKETLFVGLICLGATVLFLIAYFVLDALLK